jgi:hypothetical protein
MPTYPQLPGVLCWALLGLGCALTNGQECLTLVRLARFVGRLLSLKPLKQKPRAERGGFAAPKLLQSSLGDLIGLWECGFLMVHWGQKMPPKSKILGFPRKSGVSV